MVCRWKRGGQGCAGLYAAEGDWKNAGISLAGAVLPYAGDALKATRLVKSLAKVADGLSHLGAARGVTCRIVSAAAQAGAGAAAGAASSFAYGFVNSYIQTGDLGQAWDKGVGGMGWGALQGGLAGGVRGLVNPFVCFVAGTRVVVGVTDESGGNGLATLNSVNESGGVAVAAKLELRTRSIETIRRGDRVLGKDQHDPSAPVREYVVEETYIRTIDHLRLLTIRDTKGQEQTLKTTDDHPFFIAGEGWANASKLVPGDRLLEPDGSESEVVATAREEHPEGVTVYNFRVGEAHTYFVRQEGSTAGAVWVHNANAGYATQARNAKGKFMKKDAAVAMPGMPFQDAVLGSLGATRGGVVRTTASGRRRFPDLPVGKRFGVTDIKDALALSMSPQLRDYAALAVKNGLPFNVIISSGTRTIAKSVQAAVRESGGAILSFDMSNRTWSTVSFASKSNKVIRT